MKVEVIETLIKVLEYENHLYSKLLKLASQKTDIIIQGKIEELKKLVLEEETLVEEEKKLEQAREQILTHLSDKWDLPQEVTVWDLSNYLEKDEEDRFINIAKRLQETVVQLQYKNNLNQKLIKNSLDFIEFSMNIITESGIKGNNYAKSGREVGTVGQKNYLDIKY